MVNTIIEVSRVVEDHVPDEDPHRCQRGFSVVAVLLVSSILFFLGAGALRMIHRETLMVGNIRDSVTAYYLAEGAVQRTLSMLKEDPDYEAPGEWETFLSKTHRLGEGTYRVKIMAGSDDAIKITANAAVRKAKVELQARAKAFVENQEPEDPMEGEPWEEVRIQLVDWKDSSPY